MDQLKKLHQVLFVYDKIITYKTAAAILHVDVNEAKTILDKFVQSERDKKQEICVTHIVGGITTQEKHRLIVVAEEKYEKIKLTFKTITLDHIYSIQKLKAHDWLAIFNVDDFMYDDQTSKSEVIADKPPEVKDEPVEVAQKTTNNKKGSLTSFFSQAAASKQNGAKEEKPATENKTTKSKKAPTKPSVLSNFINNASNKENVLKTNGLKPKTEIPQKSPDIISESDDDDEPFVVRKTKKRTRVLNDDDDFQVTKSTKLDILDDDHEDDDDEVEEIKEENNELENSESDIFGSPENDPELMDSKEIKMDSEEIKMDSEETVVDSSQKDTQPSSEPLDDSDTIYPDNDGFFVTEKKAGTRKRSLEKPPETSKETKKKTKEEKQVKKELTQKLKKDINQKTLFNFFKKI